MVIIVAIDGCIIKGKIKDIPMSMVASHKRKSFIALPQQFD